MPLCVKPVLRLSAVAVDDRMLGTCTPTPMEDAPGYTRQSQERIAAFARLREVSEIVLPDILLLERLKEPLD